LGDGKLVHTETERPYHKKMDRSDGGRGFMKGEGQSSGGLREKRGGGKSFTNRYRHRDAHRPHYVDSIRQNYRAFLNMKRFFRKNQASGLSRIWGRGKKGDAPTYVKPLGKDEIPSWTVGFR